MTPRERAKLRLSRRVPGTRTGKLPKLAVRLALRDKERESFLPQRIECRVREGATIRRIRPVTVSEYAPQLIRLVRHPFELRPVRSGRRHGYDRPRLVREAREPLSPPAREMAAIRKEYSFASPIAEHPHRPDARPHPFARARRAADEDGDR